MAVGRGCKDWAFFVSRTCGPANAILSGSQKKPWLKHKMTLNDCSGHRVALLVKMCCSWDC